MKKSIHLLSLNLKRYSLIIFGLSANIITVAQKSITDDTIKLKKRIFKVSFITVDTKKSSGFLANLSDSNLYLSQSPIHFSVARIDDLSMGYSYNHLEKIEIKRKGAVGRGALKGALIGLATGMISGLISGDDPVVPAYDNSNDPFGSAISNVFINISNSLRMTAGEKAIGYGIMGAGTGALIGALLGGLAKRKFFIGRNKQKFNAMRENILEKLYVR